MSYFEFPHTRTYDGDLGFIIKKLEDLTAAYNNFFDLNKITFHDPIEWDINESYVANTIVYDENTKTLYISRAAVPSGIDITNTEYWYVVSPFKVDTILNDESINPIANKTVTIKFGSLETTIENLNSALSARIITLTTNVNNLSDALTTTNNNLAAETAARTSEDATINARIDAIIEGASVDPDAELIDIRVGENGETYPTAGDAVRGQVEMLMDRELINNTLVLSSADIIEDAFIYGNSGDQSTSVNYNCTDFIQLPAHQNAFIYFRGSLNSGAGFAFYTAEKKYISGVSGSTASASGYTTGTMGRRVQVPYNAYYIRITILKSDYSDPTDMNILYIDYTKIIKMYNRQLTADKLFYGRLSSAGETLQSTGTGSRVVTDFIKVNAKDAIISSANNFWVMEYNSSYTRVRDGGAWIKLYRVVNDGYVKIQYSTGSKTAMLSDVVIYSSVNELDEIIVNKPLNSEYLFDVLNHTPFTPIQPEFSVGNTQSGYPHFLTIGHRGYRLGVPENTIPAFIMARKMGLFAFECDVQFSSPDATHPHGVPVIIHDYTVNRTSDGSGNVKDLTYAELRALDFGSWVSNDFAGTKIPSLEETFEAARALGMFVQLELKQPDGGFTSDQLDIIINTVKKYNMNKYMNWSGLTPEQRPVILEAFPDASIQISYLLTITQEVVDEALSVKTDTNHVIICSSVAENNDDSIQLVINAGLPLELTFVDTDARIEAVHPYTSWIVTDGVNANRYIYNKFING